MKKLLLILIFTILNLNAQQIDAKQLFNIEKIKAKKIEYIDTKEYYGVTKLNEEKTIDIVSRFDGYITNLNANKNYMSIKKGEELYSIYSKEIANLQNELKIVKDMDETLYKKSSQKLLNYDIQNAKFVNNNLVVRSPISGVITQKNINNRSFVESGKTLFTISSLDNIWFVASIYQEDLKFIKENQNAKIKLDGFDKTFVAKVDFIYPIFNENKTIDIRFVLENSDFKIYPAMFGKVRIESSKDEIITLPKTAIIKKDSGYFVFIPKENGEFTPKKIEAKRLNSNLYEVISGLNLDEEVINNSLFLYDADAMTNRLYDENSDEEW